MPAVCKATTVPGAFAKPLHLWETTHALFQKPVKTSSKLFGLAAALIKCAECAFDNCPDMSTFKSTCDVINLTGKFTDFETLAYSFFDSESNIFNPGKDQKGLANTTGIDCKYQIPYILKISSLAIGSLAQTWIAVEKLFVPQLATVSEAFVAHAGNVALSIGGSNMETVAKCVTSTGLSTMKNVSLLTFLAIDGYQWYSRIQAEREKEDCDVYEVVVNQIKTIETLSKIACISLALFGAPLPIILGVGLVAAYLSVVSECQKALPKPPNRPEPPEQPDGPERSLPEETVQS